MVDQDHLNSFEKLAMDVAPVPKHRCWHVLGMGHLVGLRAEDALVLNLSSQMGQAFKIEHLDGLRSGPLGLVKNLSSDVIVVLVVSHVDIALIIVGFHDELVLLDLQIHVQFRPVFILNVQGCSMAVDLTAFCHDGQAVRKCLSFLHGVCCEQDA